MKIYTRTGDAGETGLFAGPRVWKDDARIEAYGTVDELNSFLGWARTTNLPDEIDTTLAAVQHLLFAVGAQLATPEKTTHRVATLDAGAVKALESAIDHFDGQLPPLGEFILPGGGEATARLHVCRAVCRRAERCVVSLQRTTGTTPFATVLQYLNRLSDLLFVLARAANAAEGLPEQPWIKPPLSRESKATDG